MKRLSVLVLVALLLAACSSTPPPTPTPYQKIVTFDGKTQAELYDLSLKWVAQAFKSAKAVIQVSDREAGIIACRGMLTGLSAYPIDFSMRIEVKDGRSRITFSDMEIKVTVSGQTATNVVDPSYPKVAVKLDGIIADYLAFISKQEDW